MIDYLKESLGRQYGASIDMLENAIVAAPAAFFTTHKRFFYTSFHTLVFLDYYLTIPPNDFEPGLGFTITKKEDRPEESIDDLIPDEFYSKEELLNYLNASRNKCITLINGLTESRLRERFIEDFETDAMDYPLLEILLYGLRHVQHHAAQLNQILSQQTGTAPGWVFRAGE